MSAGGCDWCGAVTGDFGAAQCDERGVWGGAGHGEFAHDCAGGGLLATVLWAGGVVGHGPVIHRPGLPRTVGRLVRKRMVRSRPPFDKLRAGSPGTPG